MLPDGHERRWREALHVPSELVGMLRKKRLCDDEDVVSPLAQRRQVNVDDVQAIVEILAETTRPDLVFEHPIGGGDDADVDLFGFAVADAKDDALLQRAQ